MILTSAAVMWWDRVNPALSDRIQEKLLFYGNLILQAAFISNLYGLLLSRSIFLNSKGPPMDTHSPAAE